MTLHWPVYELATACRATVAVKHGRGTTEPVPCCNSRLPGAIFSAGGVGRHSFPQRVWEHSLRMEWVVAIISTTCYNLQVLPASFYRLGYDKLEWLHNECEYAELCHSLNKTEAWTTYFFIFSFFPALLYSSLMLDRFFPSQITKSPSESSCSWRQHSPNAQYSAVVCSVPSR